MPRNVMEVAEKWHSSTRVQAAVLSVNFQFIQASLEEFLHWVDEE
jgi:hypothetical protein